MARTPLSNGTLKSARGRGGALPPAQLRKQPAAERPAVGEGPRAAGGFMIQGPEQLSQRCCYSEAEVGSQKASQGRRLCLHSHRIHFGASVGAVPI